MTTKLLIDRELLEHVLVAYEWQLDSANQLANYAGGTGPDESEDESVTKLRAILAAPAAPAADAGIVDMYRHLQKVTPYRFKKIQDASITDGGDVMYFHKDRFDAALLADMAAHCASSLPSGML